MTGRTTHTKELLKSQIMGAKLRPTCQLKAHKDDK